jgi:hypothetical protein
VYRRAEPLLPPFPTRTFVAVGAFWVLLDLLVVAAVFFSPLPYSFGRAWVEPLILAWGASLGAKAMLMLGWFFLGEGKLGQRLTGIFLFIPIIAPYVIGAFGDPTLLCILAMTVLFAVPVLFMLGLPYVLLKATDHRLARDAPVSHEKVGQFTVRQLMLVTFVAAIVLGLLRWAQQSDMQWAVVGLQLPLLVWVFPFVMCRGTLQTRWYPEILFAVGVTAFVLALPLFTLSHEEVGGVALFVATYVTIFAGHLLILRGLGFRMVQYKPAFQYDPGIWFVEDEEPGIQFFDHECLMVNRDRDSSSRTPIR